MAGYATTRLSSKGQVVIPEEVRTHLGLREGDRFVVVGEGDAVILKAITPPRMDQFKDLLAQARKEGAKGGIRRAHVKAAIAKIRRRLK